jgi:four helix bundle protein
MHDFRRLEVWREATELAKAIYEVTADMPSAERFGMTAQLRSAAVSVSSNIAEGAGRGTERELARFLRISAGSLAEVSSQLELAAILGLIQPQPELIHASDRLVRRVMALHDRIAGIER